MSDGSVSNSVKAEAVEEGCTCGPGAPFPCNDCLTKMPDYSEAGKGNPATAQGCVADGWQPIETAPKDGTRILVCVAGAKVADVGEWSEQYKTWESVEMLKEHFGHDEDRLLEWLASAEWPVTHWMPLPAPPVAVMEAVE